MIGSLRGQMGQTSLGERGQTSLVMEEQALGGKFVCPLSASCRQATCRPISYWEDIPSDGLFLAWTATK